MRGGGEGGARTDNDTLAPSSVGALESGTHGVDAPNSLEGVVNAEARLGKPDDNLSYEVAQAVEG